MKENRKGFTLVEFLAIIVILSLISTIVVPILTKTISKSKNSLSKEQKNAIVNAAKTYTIKNDHCGCVSIATLQEQGYLEGKEVIDPKTNTRLSGGVSLNWANNQYDYQYDANCSETKKESCNSVNGESE